MRSASIRYRWPRFFKSSGPTRSGSTGTRRSAGGVRAAGGTAGRRGHRGRCGRAGGRSRSVACRRFVLVACAQACCHNNRTERECDVLQRVHSLTPCEVGRFVNVEIAGHPAGRADDMSRPFYNRPHDCPFMDPCAQPSVQQNRSPPGRPPRRLGPAVTALSASGQKFVTTD